MMPIEQLAVVILLSLAILASLVASFFFSGAETAVISANQYQLRHLHERGEAWAGKVLAILAEPSRLLSAVLIGTNLGNVFTVLLFNVWLGRIWSGADEPAIGPLHWDELISLVVLTPVIVLLAEILPKALFRAKADAWIGGLRPVLAASMVLFRPAIWLLEGLMDLILAPFGGSEARRRTRLTRGDLIAMLNPARGNAVREGAGDENSVAAGDTPAAQEVEGNDPLETIREPDERRLIHNIIELNQTYAREVMKPLVELEAVRLVTTSIDGFLGQARRSGYSRLPVYRERVVDMIGYIDVYEVIRRRKPDSKLEDFVQPATFIPETKRIDDLLQEFLLRRIKNAVVVDEYGGCSGWVTREDIIEEIVGELEDELDQPQDDFIERGEGFFIFEGRADIRDVNEVLLTNFEDTDCDTLGGLLMKEMGRIPRVGECIALGGWRMEVVEMEGMRIDKVKTMRLEE